MSKIRFNLNILGMVQGVGFRYSALRQAKLLSLNGWVKNTKTGGVEILAEGEESDLISFMNWCYNGVSSAEVQKIIQSRSKATGEFSNFTIKY